MTAISVLIHGITVVKSGHVGGHNTAKEIGPVDSMAWFKKQDDAVDTLKYLCAKAGGNAVINLDIQKDSRADGNYCYSVFKATGNAVVIQKYEKREPNNHKNSPANKSITEELEKLVALRDKGVLTEEEFQTAKQKALFGGTSNGNVGPTR